MAFLRIFLLLALLFLSSCFGTQTTVTATSQTLANQGLQFIASLVRALRSDLAGANNCVSFQQVLNSLVGSRNCSLEGRESLQIGSITCRDTPNFEGNNTLAFTFENCREGGQTIGGTLSFELSWDGSLLFVEVFTQDYTHNGVFYVIDALALEDSGPEGPLCSGFVVTQGEVCGVTSDCNFCPL